MSTGTFLFEVMATFDLGYFHLLSRRFTLSWLCMVETRRVSLFAFERSEAIPLVMLSSLLSAHFLFLPIHSMMKMLLDISCSQIRVFFRVRFVVLVDFAPKMPLVWDLATRVLSGPPASPLLPLGVAELISVFSPR